MIFRSSVTSALTLVSACFYVLSALSLAFASEEHEGSLNSVRTGRRHVHPRALQEPAPTVVPDLDLAAEDVLIRFGADFWNYTLYFQPGYVCERRETDWNKKDTVRVCRGLSKNQAADTPPSCYVAFKPGNDLVGDGIVLPPRPSVNRNAAFLSSTGIVPVHSGFYTEFSNGRVAMTELFRQVCYVNGTLSELDVPEVIFQGHSKGGADAIVAAHYFTSGKEPSVYFPANRTRIVVTGLAKPFEKFVDPDQRQFKSITTYHAIRYSTQGPNKTPQEALIDITYFLPKGPTKWVFSSDSTVTLQKCIVKRRTRPCRRSGWFGRCSSWGPFVDDGYFVVSDWKTAGVLANLKEDLPQTHQHRYYRDWSDLAIV